MNLKKIMLSQGKLTYMSVSWVRPTIWNSRTEKATPERKNVRTVVFSVSLRAGIGKAHEGLLREMVIL